MMENQHSVVSATFISWCYVGQTHNGKRPLRSLLAWRTVVLINKLLSVQCSTSSLISEPKSNIRFVVAGSADIAVPCLPR